MAQRNDERPRHEQIAADLREQIMAGELSPGTALPSTHRLVEQYSAANPTIQKALRALKDEGFLFSQQGKGVYVRNRQPFLVEVAPFFTPSPDGYSYDLLDVAEVHPPREAADAMRLSASDTAVIRRRLMRHKGEPVELDVSYYPSEIATGPNWPIPAGSEAEHRELSRSSGTRSGTSPTGCLCACPRPRKSVFSTCRTCP